MGLDNSLIILAAAAFAVLMITYIIWLRLRPLTLECRDPLFSPEYRSFLGQLDIAVRSHLTVFPRMPINDVLTAKGAGKSLLRKLSKYRFDFVICHRREMDVLCVVQLDHADSKAPKTEQLRQLCSAAGLTLLEYDVKPYRDVPSLRRDIFGACGIDEFELPTSNFERNEDDSKEAPDCPKCNASMKRHTLKKGKHAGEPCWVCENYPDCKGAILDKHSCE